tara:strand:+ start:18446 stop:19417 length:972 start_codon:yes stop_codon:yes gene_type:complete
MKILVTGAAGFIGMHTAQKLLQNGHEVVGIDNLNSYYPVSLKEDRLNILKRHEKFQFERIDISDLAFLQTKLKDHHFDAIIHLAAQAGVRYSFENPQSYISSNLQGFFNIIEFCRHQEIKNFVFASSSSVYGNREDVPFKESDRTVNPVSLYASTKICNEAMSYNYAYNHNITCVGLRFFTVYGPWGRPDMAPLKFLDKISKGETIDIYSDGNLLRDYTYIDDITEGIFNLFKWSLEQKEGTHEIFNIGSNKPYSVLEFVENLEKASGFQANKKFVPFQPGDVQKTYASVDKLIEATGYSPKTSLSDGLKELSNWFKDYYSLN